MISVSQVWSNTGLGIRQEIEDSTNRGFTGHEHLDQVGIIHMNGRIYDPTIGRFLQADPIIQDPYDTQSLNRYSYVMNNPLSYVDPSGYSRLRSGWWRTPLAIGIVALTSGAATGQLLAGTQFGTWASTNAFGVVASGGALSGAVATGNLKGALKGAVTAVVTYGIGHGFNGKGGIQDPFARGFAHSVVSGVSAEVDGGNFGHGFVSSALSQSIGGAKIFNHRHVGLAAIVTNAILQGSISELMGGKFANGAMSSAFRVAFNDGFNGYKGAEFQTFEEALQAAHNNNQSVRRTNRSEFGKYSGLSGDPHGTYVYYNEDEGYYETSNVMVFPRDGESWGDPDAYFGQSAVVDDPPHVRPFWWFNDDKTIVGLAITQNHTRRSYSEFYQKYANEIGTVRVSTENEYPPSSYRFDITTETFKAQ